MKKVLLLLLSAATLLVSAPKKPKLVVAIICDQFRYDYLTRFRSEYHGGFDRLLSKGAVFTNASYQHFPTVTAVGHSTFLSGATPSVSGIVGNDWWDRDAKKHVTSVSDPQAKLLGAEGEGASPHRMLVSTVGDELKMSNGGKSRVIGISLKDRAAILPVGHMANGAYWFDLKSGNFVSSTYYFADLPAWVKEFNAGKSGEKYRGVKWLDHILPMEIKTLYGNNTESPLEQSPFGNEIVEMFAERALVAEQLGTHEATDLLAVSFSSNDKVGHHYGPYSAEEHQVAVETDRQLERLFTLIDKQVGLDNVLFVFSSDHGVAPSVSEDKAHHMPGGQMKSDSVKEAVQAALVQQYGAGDWVLGSWDLSIYLNTDLATERGIDPAELRRKSAQAAMALPHIARVYTRDQMAASPAGDEITRRMANGFNFRRSPDLMFLPEPYWVLTKDATTHGTTYGYDSHVPVIFMGPEVRAGRYDGRVTVNDIAPTLATILDVETPSGSIGRVLTEMLEPGK